MSGFWSPGFWAAAFWSPGFWGEEVAAVSPAPTSGGSSKVPRKRRRVVFDWYKPLPPIEQPVEDEEALHLLGMI